MTLSPRDTVQIDQIVHNVRQARERMAYEKWLKELVAKVRERPAVDGVCVKCGEPMLVGVGCMREAYRSLTLYATLVLDKKDFSKEYPYIRWRDLQLKTKGKGE